MAITKTAENENRSIGQSIRARRESVGMNQQELADACGVSRETVSNWELGKRKIGPGYLAVIAKVLGFQPGDTAEDAISRAVQSDRIKRWAEQAISTREPGWAVLGRRSGLDEATLHAIRNGERVPADLVIRFARAAGQSIPEALLVFHYPELASIWATHAFGTESGPESLAEDERELVEIYRSVPAAHRQALRHLLQSAAIPAAMQPGGSEAGPDADATGSMEVSDEEMPLIEAWRSIPEEFHYLAWEMLDVLGREGAAILQNKGPGIRGQGPVRRVLPG